MILSSVVDEKYQVINSCTCPVKKAEQSHVFQMVRHFNLGNVGRQFKNDTIRNINLIRFG